MCAIITSYVASVPSRTQNGIELRARVHWQSEAPDAINIRTQRQQQQARQRERLNSQSRARQRDGETVHERRMRLEREECEVCAEE